MIEHIQNLDIVLADLKKAGIIIAEAKSQFCCFGIKIPGYICDSERRHSDTSKVLKILDLLHCVDITITQVFMGVCGYY